MYNLKPSDFTNGRYGLVTESGPMVTATDTYNIGRMAYLAEDMEATADWMGETLRLIGNESSQGNSPDRLLVLDHLAFAEFKVLDCTLYRHCLYSYIIQEGRFKCFISKLLYYAL